MLPGQLWYGQANLSLFEDRDNLFFTESLPFHLGSLWLPPLYRPRLTLQTLQFQGFRSPNIGTKSPLLISQWSSPQTSNPVDPKTEAQKTEGGAFNRVRRFHFPAGMFERIRRRNRRQGSFCSGILKSK
jgi:hypothetical protein